MIWRTNAPWRTGSSSIWWFCGCQGLRRIRWVQSGQVFYVRYRATEEWLKDEVRKLNNDQSNRAKEKQTAYHFSIFLARNLFLGHVREFPGSLFKSSWPACICRIIRLLQPICGHYVVAESDAYSKTSAASAMVHSLFLQLRIRCTMTACALSVNPWRQVE